MNIEELKARREPILEVREANRTKGDKMSEKVEADCNAELVKLNLAIKGVQPYEPVKKAAAKSSKKSDPLA